MTSPRTPQSAADHHLRADARELMHGGQPADENEIADLAMAAQRRRGRKNHVVADLAVVADMAAIHEVAAIADAGDAAAGRGAGVHGRLLTDGAALADLELASVRRDSPAICGGPPSDDERIDRAVVADRGLRGDVDMRDQLAVRRRS